MYCTLIYITDIIRVGGEQMNQEAIRDYVIYNGKLLSTKELDLFKISLRPAIYEVIRVIDGEPLYLEEHISRLRKSAKLLNMKINKEDNELIEEIYSLIKKNESPNLNIKILCNGFHETIENVFLYFVNSFYPPKSLYNDGIHTILYESERDNPNAKISNKELRAKIDKIRKKEEAFEALLVNHRGQITEGSRSNVFFVGENKIFTPPSKKVLLGVTRTKILELCHKNGIQVIEKDILVNKVKEYDGAFITGTSINVLPIKSINDKKLDSEKNYLIKKLMGIYEDDMKNYISKRKIRS